MATGFKVQVSKFVLSRNEELLLIIGSGNCLKRLCVFFYHFFFFFFFENGAGVEVCGHVQICTFSFDFKYLSNHYSYTLVN